MEYYKPSILFRQNAMKRVCSDSQVYQTSKSKENWLLNNFEHDNEVLNKSCALNKVQIASNYWKIPDDEYFLTGIAVNQENQEQIAISSGKKDSNLFIYDLNVDKMILTHEQTISLPSIESMKWLEYEKEQSVLLTGNKSGMVHMVSIPDSKSSENARILKRFNHKKHFSSSKLKNIAIKKIEIPSWSKDSSTFLSLCNENIFLWDLNHRSDLPIMKNKNLGVQAFDPSPSRNGIVALSGDFGIALNDLRAPSGTPSIFSPREAIDVGTSNFVKWAPYDSNVLAASHVDGIVRLWDIRSQNAFAELEGHDDLVSSLEWSEESSTDLYSGSRDGNIIHWNLDFTEDLSHCGLKEGLDSIGVYKNQFLTDRDEIYKYTSTRQCGTIIPASKESIIGLTSSNGKLLSIDGSSFIGVHEKRGEDSFTVEEGTSSRAMELLLKELPSSSGEESNDVSDVSSDADSLFEPLHVDSVQSSINVPPLHTKQNSITLQMNNSENSVLTMLPSDIESGKVRRYSGSTINETDGNDDTYEEYPDFTYQEILPLNKKLAAIATDFDLEQQQMALIMD